MHRAHDLRIAAGQVPEGAGVEFDMPAATVVDQAGREAEPTEQLHDFPGALVPGQARIRRHLLLRPLLPGSFGPLRAAVGVGGQHADQRLGQPTMPPVGLGRLDGDIHLTRPTRAPGPLDGAADQPRPLQDVQVDPGRGHVETDRLGQGGHIQWLYRGAQQFQQTTTRHHRQRRVRSIHSFFAHADEFRGSLPI